MAKVAALKITSRPATFNRAGHQFSAEPTTILLADLKQEQVDKLKAEPNLVVADVEIDVPDEEGKEEAKKEANGSKAGGAKK